MVKTFSLDTFCRVYRPCPKGSFMLNWACPDRIDPYGKVFCTKQTFEMIFERIYHVFAVIFLLEVREKICGRLIITLCKVPFFPTVICIHFCLHVFHHSAPCLFQYLCRFQKLFWLRFSLFLLFWVYHCNFVWSNVDDDTDLSAMDFALTVTYPKGPPLVILPNF